MPVQKTYVAKRETRRIEWDRNWYVVDAKGQPLGRLAAQIAKVLQGKHKPCYTPHVDVGDYVVVINAAHIKVTGKKAQQKLYRHHSGYPSGLRERPLQQVLEEAPTLPLYEAVRRMLPKNTLGRRMLKKLKLYPEAQHPHSSQNPEPLTFGSRGPQASSEG